MEKKRMLGRSGIAVGAIGSGCWAIGGDSFGKVDDEESIRAIRVALEMGANLFDTANVYGGGHSERVLGEALKGRRAEAAIATKFGYVYDEEAGAITGECATREHILSACEASLKRLGTDYIDLYLLHIGALTGDAAAEAIGALEELVSAGKICSYGWSTDTPENARRIGKNRHCAAIEYQLNLFYENAEITRICEESDVAGLIRGPLAMGALTGKYGKGARLPGEDVRGRNIEWVPYFNDGALTDRFAQKLRPRAKFSRAEAARSRRARSAGFSRRARTRSRSPASSPPRRCGKTLARWTSGR
jgi:aryl-alcohol dehydrogenase-like predicted oxidoreductase